MVLQNSEDPSTNAKTSPEDKENFTVTTLTNGDDEPCYGVELLPIKVDHSSSSLLPDSQDSVEDQTSEVFLQSSQTRGCTWVLRKLTDIVTRYFVLAFLVVAYWSSTWSLCDEYLVKNDRCTSVWMSAGFGFTIFTIATVFQNDIMVFVTNRRSYLVRFLLQRVYGYIIALACIDQWRGTWGLLDYYMGMSFKNAMWTYIIANITLILMRCVSVTVTPPLRIRMDFPHDCFYEMTTFYSLKPDQRTLLRLLDAMFTYCLVSALGICVWRGLWEIVDFKLCPDDIDKSAVWSLGISYGLLLLLAVVQRITTRVSVYLEGVHIITKVIFEDVITLLSTVVCVFMWRGYWLLLATHLPCQPDSLWVGHILSFIIMAVGLVSNAIIARGCDRDGEEQEGRGVMIEANYVTYLVKGLHKDNTEISENNNGEL